MASYAEWFRSYWHVARATMFWICLVAILMGVADWLDWSIAVSVLDDLRSGNPKPLDFRAFAAVALYALGLVAFFLGLADVAVNWHRRVILKENPKLFGRNLVHKYYWNYLGKLILVLAVAAIPLVIIFGLVALDDDFDLNVDSDDSTKFDCFVPVAGSLLLFTVALIFVRLSLLLPAATSGLRLTWMQSVKFTSGNSLRLIVGHFLCGIAPGCLIDQCLRWTNFVANEMSSIEILIATGSSELIVRQSIMRQILAATVLIVLPIGVEFLSCSYQQLSPRMKKADVTR